MFYQSNILNRETGNHSALIALTPSESKRLIAKGVATLPEVKKSLEKGLIIIARGTTNAFVAEEVMGTPLESRAEYCRGYIANGELRVNRKPAAPDFVLRHGKVDNIRPQEAILEFTSDDIFIKGANAIDSLGQAAVLTAGTEGGTIGYALVTVTARAAHLIVPAGLEKLIPSVSQASQKCGINKFKYSMGSPCALIPMVNAKIVTEIQALEILTRVQATHIASGGIGGSEGTVILALEGKKGNIEQAIELLNAIKDEPPVRPPD